MSFRAAILPWLSAFSVTQIVEVPIYLLALASCSIPRRTLDDRRRVMPTRLAMAFGASLLTHPVVWFVFPALWPSIWPSFAGEPSYRGMVFACEIFAWLAEALYFYLLGLSEPLRWSLVANAASVAVGLALRTSFGWP